MQIKSDSSCFWLKSRGEGWRMANENSFRERKMNSRRNEMGGEERVRLLIREAAVFKDKNQRRFWSCCSLSRSVKTKSLQRGVNRMRKIFMLFGLVICALVVSMPSWADDLKECMSEMMSQVSDSMTIGDLRLKCQEQIQSGAYPAAEKEEAVVSERFRLDKEHVLEPFTIMAHKPNYLLFGAYNSAGYDAELFREQYDNSTINFDDTEAQFQVSIKVPLMVNLFDTLDVYGAYTNRSFWQYYNDDISSPFRETNHEPELWAQFRSNWEFFGFTNTSNWFGIVHQSNGQGGVLSRSWNRLYANFIVERGNFAFQVKPWYRIQEDDDDDDNPDITDYLGHYELRAAYKWKEHVFSVMSRNNLESGFSKGAVEMAWSFPLWDYPYLKGYVQYFTGYGESLIDYDSYVNRIGIGIALTDFL
jgi:phospholipase A1